MSSRRVLKAAEAIREVVSTAILLELRDPRVQDVTVTRVEVSGDMRNAKVFVSVMGDESKESLSLHGLKNSAGYLQQRVGERIDTRYIPRLAFEIDKGLKNSLKVAALLEEVKRQDRSRLAAADPTAAETTAADPHPLEASEAELLEAGADPSGRLSEDSERPSEDSEDQVVDEERSDPLDSRDVPTPKR